MMKFNYMKKKLIVESVVTVALIAAAAGATMYVMGLSETAIKEKGRIESAIRSVESQISDYQTQLGKADESISIYAEMTEFRGEDLQFDTRRTEAARILQSMLNKYRIEVTTSQIGPLAPLEGPAYNGIEMDIELSEISIELQAITDQHVYSFLEEFTKRFPGIVRINSFDIEREREITSNTLFQAHNGGTPLLVKAVLSAEWIVFTDKRAEGGGE